MTIRFFDSKYSKLCAVIIRYNQKNQALKYGKSKPKLDNGKPHRF